MSNVSALSAAIEADAMIAVVAAAAPIVAVAVATVEAAAPAVVVAVMIVAAEVAIGANVTPNEDTLETLRIIKNHLYHGLA